jgi:hypothetical protein
MDYSLLIFKISWGGYLKENPSIQSNIIKTLTRGEFAILPEIPQTDE